MYKNSKLMLFMLLIAASQTMQAEQRCHTESIIATAPTSRYQQNSDDTVVDKETGLMWRSCLEGVMGDSCEQGEALALNWADALLHVSKLNNQDGFAGHKDWRLPNIKEIVSLIELQCIDPAINLSVFPNTASSELWTSSPSRFIHDYAWFINFKTGAYTYTAGERTKAKHIRLVRDADLNQDSSSLGSSLSR